MYNIDFRKIEYFLSIAKTLNFSEAARISFVSQPTLSKMIISLEEELDIQLFLRDKKRVVLTEEGKLLAKEWEQLLKEFHGSVEKAHRIKDQIEGTLKIGCLTGFEYYNFLPQLIHSYEEKYKNIIVSLEFYGFRELRDKLLSGDLDIVFSTTFDLENLSGISQKVVDEIKVYIAVPYSNPLSNRENLNLQDLENETFFLISPEESRGASECVIASCKKAGFNLHRIVYVPNTTSLEMSVSQGKGVAILSNIIQKRNENYIKLYDTADLPIDAYNILAWKSHGATGSALRFVELFCTKTRI